jgi:hypothetical protein
MVNMLVARPGEILQMQFRRTLRPPLLRNPEQGRKSGHFGYFSMTCGLLSRLNGRHKGVAQKLRESFGKLP